MCIHCIYGLYFVLYYYYYYYYYYNVWIIFCKVIAWLIWSLNVLWMLQLYQRVCVTQMISSMYITRNTDDLSCDVDAIFTDPNVWIKVIQYRYTRLYEKNRCFWSFWKKHVIYRWCGGASGETEPPHHGKALQLSHHFHQRTLPLKLTKAGVMKTPLSVKGWGAPVALFHGQHGGSAPPATLISHVPELHRILEVLHSTVLASR